MFWILLIMLTNFLIATPCQLVNKIIVKWLPDISLMSEYPDIQIIKLMST